MHILPCCYPLPGARPISAAAAQLPAPPACNHQLPATLRRHPHTTPGNSQRGALSTQAQTSRAAPGLHTARDNQAQAPTNPAGTHRAQHTLRAQQPSHSSGCAYASSAFRTSPNTSSGVRVALILCALPRPS
jgi:hypothetical protein